MIGRAIELWRLGSPRCISGQIRPAFKGVDALPEPAALEQTTMAVATSRCSKDELTEWLRRQLAPK